MSDTPRCNKTVNEGRHVCRFLAGHEGGCRAHINSPVRLPAVDATTAAPRMHTWPDGQVREEEPYRCGAFIASTGEQCMRWSDHDGPHAFVSDAAPSPLAAAASPFVDPNEIDDLLAAFQQACVHVNFANDISKATKERAILRNDLRARLLAKPDTPSDDPPRAADATPSDNSLAASLDALIAAQAALGRAIGDEWTAALRIRDKQFFALSNRLTEIDAATAYAEAAKHNRASEAEEAENEITALRAQVGSLTGALEEAGEQYREAVLVGSQLANFAFNVAQRAPSEFTEQHRQTLSDCRKRWDGVMEKHVQQRAAARPPETPE